MEEKDKRIVLLGHIDHVNAMAQHLLSVNQGIVVFQKRDICQESADFKQHYPVPDKLLNPLTSFKLKMPRKMKKRLKKLLVRDFVK